ncbi:hypothetical protein TSOC_004281 [Tetrabaena socialis]|uniref:Uncharacterized protein n=1 Tax=Tetrabaena socialis TaxID=47790 RepID=A0A2J8A9E0_9CHLO|nr:hypothetical protein TSOC_004281 [Tetrabaena socialis]|eukprot:PNH09120.1 hypothetical protein TSOC_004281 [Tetrabaena socialis]
MNVKVVCSAPDGRLIAASTSSATSRSSAQLRPICPNSSRRVSRTPLRQDSWGRTNGANGREDRKQGAHRSLPYSDDTRSNWSPNWFADGSVCPIESSVCPSPSEPILYCEMRRNTSDSTCCGRRRPFSLSARLAVSGSSLRSLTSGSSASMSLSETLEFCGAEHPTTGSISVSHLSSNMAHEPSTAMRPYPGCAHTAPTGRFMG